MNFCQVNDHCYVIEGTLQTFVEKYEKIKSLQTKTWYAAVGTSSLGAISGVYLSLIGLFACCTTGHVCFALSNDLEGKLDDIVGTIEHHVQDFAPINPSLGARIIVVERRHLPGLAPGYA